MLIFFGFLSLYKCLPAGRDMHWYLPPSRYKPSWWRWFLSSSSPTVTLDVCTPNVRVLSQFYSQRKVANSSYSMYDYSLLARNCFHRLEKKIANSPTAYLSFLLRETTTFTIIGSHYYFYWEKFWRWVNGLPRNLIDRMVENYVLRNVFNEPNTTKLQISVSLSKHKRPWVWKFWTSLRVSYLLFFKFR